MSKNKIPWTQEEIDYIEKYYAEKSNETLSKELFKRNRVFRSPTAIKLKANKKGLIKGLYWSEPEVDYLKELIGEYPLPRLTAMYNQWASKNNYRIRSERQVKEKIKCLKESIRLNSSSEYFTSRDFSYLLGCDRTTACKLFRTYQNELKLGGEIKPNGSSYCTRKNLRTFLIEHQEFLRRYQKTLDMNWLIDILLNF